MSNSTGSFPCLRLLICLLVMSLASSGCTCTTSQPSGETRQQKQVSVPKAVLDSSKAPSIVYLHNAETLTDVDQLVEVEGWLDSDPFAWRLSIGNGPELLVGFPDTIRMKDMARFNHRKVRIVGLANWVRNPEAREVDPNTVPDQMVGQPGQKIHWITVQKIELLDQTR